MSEMALYVSILVAVTFVAVILMKLLDQVEDVPRTVALVGAICIIALGATKDPNTSVLFYFVGLILLTAGLPAQWRIYPASLAAFGPLLLLAFGTVSLTLALGMFAFSGPIAAVVGVMHRVSQTDSNDEATQKDTGALS